MKSSGRLGCSGGKELPPLPGSKKSRKIRQITSKKSTTSIELQGIISDRIVSFKVIL
jgi:hypothetical protein